MYTIIIKQNFELGPNFWKRLEFIGTFDYFTQKISQKWPFFFWTVKPFYFNLKN